MESLTTEVSTTAPPEVVSVMILKWILSKLVGSENLKWMEISQSSFHIWVLVIEVSELQIM
jgi:hypothetical protein